jgi:hypothetical protein
LSYITAADDFHQAAYMDAAPFSPEDCNLADQCSNPDKGDVMFRACETGSSNNVDAASNNSDYTLAFPPDDGVPANSPVTLVEISLTTFQGSSPAGQVQMV